ncbi:Recombinase [Niallia circulans]|uniref:recombinase family protein n=1 Tax=Shouchella clausii TaxID=79880 RepID=UPI000BA5EC57|nr:recombinase family protein [Shouchella clausii]MCM3548566.1 recombinase family protein [Shouchella clausii]PAF11889.1 hypothetical protein CHH59_21205 [Shouchella clausii]SPT81517.1 Recombinase [Niallia circulans]
MLVQNGTKNTIKGILNTPAYTGSLVHNREETKKFLSDSELYKIRKKFDKQITFKNTHRPLISEEDFRTVQELMKSKRNNRSNGKESLFALSLNVQTVEGECTLSQIDVTGLMFVGAM